MVGHSHVRKRNNLLATFDGFPKIFQDICAAGQNCVLDIDVEGVKSLKAYIAKEARFWLGTLHSRSTMIINWIFASSVIHDMIHDMMGFRDDMIHDPWLIWIHSGDAAFVFRGSAAWGRYCNVGGTIALQRRRSAAVSTVLGGHFGRKICKVLKTWRKTCGRSNAKGAISTKVDSRGVPWPQVIPRCGRRGRYPKTTGHGSKRDEGEPIHPSFPFSIFIPDLFTHNNILKHHKTYSIIKHPKTSEHTRSTAPSSGTPPFWVSTVTSTAAHKNCGGSPHAWPRPWGRGCSKWGDWYYGYIIHTSIYIYIYLFIYIIYIGT